MLKSPAKLLLLATLPMHCIYSAAYATALPFYEDFETAQLGDFASQPDNDWVFEGDGSADVLIVAANTIHGGSQGLRLTGNSRVSHTFSSTDSVTWTNMWVKPALATENQHPETEVTDAVMLHFNSLGQVEVLDGSTWTTLIGGGTFDESTYIRITIQSNHTSRTWDLWINGEVVASDLAFQTDSPATYFSQIKLSNDSSTPADVDDIAVTLIPPIGLVGLSTPDRYYGWAGNFNWAGPASQSNDSSDPDADGVVNQLEYAMDMDPLAADSQSLPYLTHTMDENGTWAHIHFRRNKLATDVNWTLLQASTLQPDSWAAISADGINTVQTILDSDIDGDSSAELIEIKVKLETELEQQRRFFRLDTNFN